MKNNKPIFTDLVCFSHLRWDFVFQRPQHLLSRFAKHFRTIYVEEPIDVSDKDRLEIKKSNENVWVVVPLLKNEGSPEDKNLRQKTLLNEFFSLIRLHDYICWYYTPLALNVSDQLEPRMVVYDCMDELSAFKFAPPQLQVKEKELLQMADIVFTGGHSLFQAKKHLHNSIYPFPSSIDKDHFAKARQAVSDPADQAALPHPRIGYYGVIDERMDLELVEGAARMRPDWQFIFIGPVVKIDPQTLPNFENIHYLGNKSYSELPLYLHGWDAAMIPFAKNESTKYISPTKTPEYLAAGKPVISTSIADVVDPYGNNGLVHIADTPEAFIASAEKAFVQSRSTEWLENVDEFLAENSWDKTWRYMMSLILEKLNKETINKETIGLDVSITKKSEAYV